MVMDQKFLVERLPEGQFRGAACGRCGGRIRYISANSCVPCTKARATARGAAIRAKAKAEVRAARQAVLVRLGLR